MTTTKTPAENRVAPATPWRIFVAFLVLGVSAFGGPVAHIGYFRTEFVERRRWIEGDQFQDLVALCQFLPGPASSQVGIAIGMLRGGWLGGLAAWVGFTAPSAVLMIALGIGTSVFATGIEGPLVHGLKLAAVAIVAMALWQMARAACTDPLRLAFAAVACIVMLFTSLAWVQIAVIALAAVAGRLLLAPDTVPAATSDDAAPFSRPIALAAAGTLAAALIALPLVAEATAIVELSVVSKFFRVGALVFGGGHVVLPLLQAEVVPPGWVDNDIFLAGYGAAQAVPGPLLTFAGYLGAVAAPDAGGAGGWIGGLIALVAIFAPSFLILMATLPYWHRLRAEAGLRTALAGVNAAVVGLLLAVYFDPVWTSSVVSPRDFAVVVAAVTLLVWRRVPVWLVVVLTAAAGAWAGST